MLFGGYFKVVVVGVLCCCRENEGGREGFFYDALHRFHFQICFFFVP